MVVKKQIKFSLEFDFSMKLYIVASMITATWIITANWKYHVFGSNDISTLHLCFNKFNTLFKICKIRNVIKCLPFSLFVVMKTSGRCFVRDRSKAKTPRVLIFVNWMWCFLNQSNKYIKSMRSFSHLLFVQIFFNVLNKIR